MIRMSRRLKIALAESQHIKEYDYVFVNQDVEDTANKLLAILQGNRSDDKFDSEQFCEEMGKLLEILQKDFSVIMLKFHSTQTLKKDFQEHKNF